MAGKGARQSLGAFYAEVYASILDGRNRGLCDAGPFRKLVLAQFLQLAQDANRFARRNLDACRCLNEFCVARPLEMERLTVVASLASVGRWVSIYFGWRPNLPDEGDNHLYELAVAGAAEAIITHNLRDFRGAELKWNRPRVVTPAQALELEI